MATINEVDRLDTFAWSEAGQIWFLYQVLNGIPDYEAAANVDLGLAPDYVPLWNKFVAVVGGLSEIEFVKKEAV